MDGVKRVSGKGIGIHHASSVDHRRIQKSTTLNRKFVKRPVAKARINIAAGSAAQSLRMQEQGQQQRRQIQQQQQRAQQQQAGQQQAQQQQQRAQQRGAQDQRQQQQAQQARAQQQQIRARQQVLAVRQQQAGQQQKRGLLQKQAGIRLNPLAKRTQQQQAQQQQQRQQQQRAQQQQVGQQKAGRQIAVEKQQQDRGVQRNHVVQVAKARQAARKAEPVHLSAQELKDRAIKQALRKVGQVENDTEMITQFSESKQEKQHFWQKRRFAVAVAMVVISFGLLGYLVYLNMPDISVRVAAMQTGIDKAYPSYVPADYRLDGLVKEDAGRITMNFKNSEGKKFTLMEEKSSWDSSAVLSNYVKKNWGSDYSIAKGQGLTIYVSKSNAAWVNGGVFYVITDDEGNLSSTDLHDIAVSL